MPKHDDASLVITPAGQLLSASSALKSARGSGLRCAQCGQPVHLRPSKKGEPIVTHISGAKACAQGLALLSANKKGVRAAHALAKNWRLPVPLTAGRTPWQAADSVVERLAVPGQSPGGPIYLLAQTYARPIIVAFGMPPNAKRPPWEHLEVQLPVLSIDPKEWSWQDLLRAYEGTERPGEWQGAPPLAPRNDNKWGLFDELIYKENPLQILNNRQAAHYNLRVPQTIEQVLQDIRGFELVNKLPQRVISMLSAWRRLPNEYNAYGEFLNPFLDTIDTRPEQVPLAWVYFRVCIEGLHALGLRWSRQSMASRIAQELRVQSALEVDDFVGFDPLAEADFAHNLELLLDPDPSAPLSKCLQLLEKEGCIYAEEADPDQFTSLVELR